MGQKHSKSSKNLKNFGKLYGNTFSSKKRKWFQDFERCIRGGCNIEIMCMLLNQVLISDIFDDRDDSLLHYIAKVDNEGITHFLIKAGCNVNHKNKHGDPPLTIAIIFNNIKMVKILLESGATLDNNQYKDGYGPLHIASHTGFIEIVKLLLDAGADVNALTNTKRIPLQAALSEAAFFGVKIHWKRIYDLTKLLIDAGSNVNNTDRFGRTSLHLAVRGCKAKVVQLLLENGALVAIADQNDVDPLFYSLDEWVPTHEGVEFITDQTESIKLLIEYGADVNRINEDLLCSLDFAVGNIFSDPIVEYLLNNKLILDFTSSRALHDLNELFCCKPATALVIIKYAALFNEQNDIHKLRNFDLRKFTWELQNYYKKCTDELELMKSSDTIVTSIFFKILTGEATSRYTRNELIVKAFENDYILTQFPIYRTLLTERFEKDKKKQNLLQKATKGLSRILRWDENAQAVIFDNIFQYLSEKDLCALKLVR